MRVLVIEDDPLIQKLLQRGLALEGYAVQVVGSGRAGMQRAAVEDHDLLVLDLGLEDIDGLEVARRLRSIGNKLPDRLAGFAAGADDYLVKPFAVQELAARLRAIAQRAGRGHGEARLEVDDLVLDRRAHEVRRAGQILDLAPKEFAVLELLMENPGRAFPRSTILERVWEYSFDGISNVVDVSISRLRKAVDSGRERPLIQTVRGVGYKIKA